MATISKDFYSRKMLLWNNSTNVIGTGKRGKKSLSWSFCFFLEFLFFLSYLWLICKTFFPVIDPWTWATQVDFLDSSIKTHSTVKSPQDFLQLEWFFNQLSHELLRSIKLCLPIRSKVFPLNWRLGIHGGIWCWCCEAHFILALLQLSQL